jgi:hypothetical protein
MTFGSVSQAEEWLQKKETEEEKNTRRQEEASIGPK